MTNTLSIQTYWNVDDFFYITVRQLMCICLLTAVQESRRCVVSVTTEAHFISSSSSTSSEVNSVSSCGSKSHPWRLEAAAGQRINISLLDFTVMSTSATDRPRDRVTCRQYGYVLEKSNKRNVSVCGGGGAELRQSHVYISDSNNLEIVRTTNEQMSDNEQSFLIKVEGTIIHITVYVIVFVDVCKLRLFKFYR